MASAKILQRAETAMEIDEDFLSSDEDDEGVIDEDSENCRENAYAEGEESENEAVEETKSNAAEQEPESISEQQDDERKANASYLDSTEDDQTENSEKGVMQKLKSLIGDAIRPFGKLLWKVDINFAASNRASKKNNREKDSELNPKDEEKTNSSFDTAEIKRLRMENRRLEKLADKFLNEYIQLKRKIGELSEVEGQLVACRSSYDSLKAELQELQNNRESLRQEMFKQSEEHRAEVNRLKDELKKMANGLPMMGLVKKSV